MPTVKRFDKAEFKKPVKQDNGWMRVDGYLSRTGIFEYIDADGKLRRELREDSEVFKPETLASFALVPLTLGHPPEPLNARNVKKYFVGTVGEVRRDGDFVAGPVYVQDADAVDVVERGDARELSCGYTCDVDDTPGVWKGERYDAKQTNIRGNHLAIVKRGRAGREVRLRLDSTDAAMKDLAGIDAGQDDEPTDKRRENEMPMTKIRRDGVEYEGSDQLAQVLIKEDAAHDKAVAELKSQLETAQKLTEKEKARADAAEAESKKQKERADKAEDPKHMRSVMGARFALESDAKEFIGEKFKTDGLTDLEIRKAVLTELSPELKLDGKSDAYIEARYDLAVEAERADAEDDDDPEEREDSDDIEDEIEERKRAARKPANGRVKRELAAVRGRRDDSDDGEEDDDNVRLDEDSARAKMLKTQRDAWKKPLAISKS